MRTDEDSSYVRHCLRQLTKSSEAHRSDKCAKALDLAPLLLRPSSHQAFDVVQDQVVVVRLHQRWPLIA